MRDIERSARKLYSFCSDTYNDYQETAIGLSINSLVGWNNYNLGILPIGSISSISKNINYLLYLCKPEDIYVHDKTKLVDELKINDFSKFKSIDESFYTKFIDIILYNSSGNIDEDYYMNNFEKKKKNI